MAVKKKSEKRIKKENYWNRLKVIANKYTNVMFIDADNVSSQQVQKIRQALRAIGAVMVMGKNVSRLLNHVKRPSTKAFSTLPHLLIIISESIEKNTRKYYKFQCF